MDTKIRYMRDKHDRKVLPFQYYNELGLVSLPADGKRVFIPRWPLKTKTVEPEFVHLNTCILTGAINNLTVVDFDVADSGLETYKSISDRVITTTVRTASGGIHWYFKYNPNIPSMNRILDDDGNRVGIDVKNDKAIVIAPPSVIDGQAYKFVRGRTFADVRPIKMPRWLEKYLLEHMKASTRKRVSKKSS